jgi:hypothetical protein
MNAEKAFEIWENQQMFGVSLIEEHGFICGYNEALRNNKNWEQEYLNLRQTYYQLLKKQLK